MTWVTWIVDAINAILAWLAKYVTQHEREYRRRGWQ
jgi:hypothetical protein